MNLNALDSRFFRICWRRFGSVVMARGKAGSNSMLNGRLLDFRHVPEVAFHRIAHRGKAHFLGLHRDGAGLDLGQVQDVRDEIEQIRAGRINVAGKFDLFGR